MSNSYNENVNEYKFNRNEKVQQKHKDLESISYLKCILLLHDLILESFFFFQGLYKQKTNLNSLFSTICF